MQSGYNLEIIYTKCFFHSTHLHNLESVIRNIFYIRNYLVCLTFLELLYWFSNKFWNAIKRKKPNIQFYLNITNFYKYSCISRYRMYKYNIDDKIIVNIILGTSIVSK